MKSKILVLFCGGTIAMIPDQKGTLHPPESSEALHAILKLEPSLMDMVDLDLCFVANIDSTNMNPLLWSKIARIILEKADEYDGFLITHGTDTMAYTAAALSFALLGFPKPVVITGSQIPGYRKDSDGRSNLIHSVEWIEKRINGVVIVFGSKVIEGTRASKTSHERLDAFSSINSQDLARIGTRMDVFRRPQSPIVRLESYRIQFSDRVAVLSLVPGMKVETVERWLDTGIEGLVLIAFGTGNLPHDLERTLIKAKKAMIPVVIRTQCLEGSTCMHRYQTGKLALQSGAIEAFDMSLETTITKLMWALQSCEKGQVAEIMKANLLGEIRGPSECEFEPS